MRINEQTIVLQLGRNLLTHSGQFGLDCGKRSMKTLDLIGNEVRGNRLPGQIRPVISIDEKGLANGNARSNRYTCKNLVRHGIIR